MRKIRILVVFADTTGGVGFYRSIQPHAYLGDKYSELFDVRFITAHNIDWKDLKGLETFDIIHIHKGLFQHMDDFYKAIVHLKTTNTVTVLDVDDNWELPPTHPNYEINRSNGLYNTIRNNVQIVDYVTTTTPIFANKIYKVNKHVTVIPNTIDPDADNFKSNKKKSKRLRFGFIMGSAHEEDLRSMGDFIGQIPKEVMDKIQIVLCGYDLRGKIVMIDQVTKQTTERQIMPEETAWYKYEQILTKNFTTISEDYRKYLLKYPREEYGNVENEPYRRIWSKPISEYYSLYDEIDVLLAPLADNDFNRVKSELKVIECCYSDTALIASNIGPYKLTLRNALADGVFDPNGHALLVDKPEQWAEYITFLTENPNYLDILRMNIHDANCQRYSISNISQIRADFYQSIVRYRE